MLLGRNNHMVQPTSSTPNAFTATGRLWKYPSEKAAWYFVTIRDANTEIIRSWRGQKRGWGQVKVDAQIGSTTWTTSVFPEKQHFLLPIKKHVREKAGIEPGDILKIKIKRFTK